MNIHQEHLLGLIKEIDQICRKHDIRYYSAGGTVIGAVRHGGFIPWDDDIDIYMTRDEFRRFVKAFEEDGREDRALEYHEGNHEFYSMIPRYLERDTTMFCRYHMVGRSVAGTLIDIFILDPAPNTFDEQREYLAKLFVYCDLVMPVYTYSNRTPEKYLHFYEEYRALIDDVGYHEAIARIEEDLFSIEEKDSDFYSLRWGSVPHIFPKSMIGDPVYMPFEDMKLPMPRQWYEYLVMLYGSGWMEIPYVDLRDEHTNILRYDMSYEYYFEKRDDLFDQKELMDLYWRRKDLRLQLLQVGRPIEELIKDFEASICMENVKKNLAQAQVDSAKALYEEGRYDDIVSIFAPYVEQQTSYFYMGGQRHADYYHWIYPIVIPIGDGDLDCLLRSLLRTGNMRAVEKIAGIYQRANKVSPAVERALGSLRVINEAGLLYYTGEYEACREMIEGSETEWEITKLREYFWLSAVKTGLSEEQAEELEREASGEPAIEGIRKAWGDWLWAQGRKDEAEDLYRELMAACRNGMFWNDIRDRGIEIPEIPIEKPTAFVDTPVTKKQKQLLDEVVDLCARHEIHYSIGSSLARRMYVCHDIGYSIRNRVIYMDAENAVRFLAAFAEERPEGRCLRSWENDDGINDLAIQYEDASSIYCDFRRLEQWRHKGLSISIYVLRSDNAPFLYRKSVYYREFLLNLMSLEDVDIANLKTTRKHMLHSLVSRSYSDRRKENYRRKLFGDCISKEAASSGGKYYYYKNVRGRRPKKVVMPEEYLRDTVGLEMDGRVYQIPAAVAVPNYGNEPDLGNVPPRMTYLIFRNDDMTWDEIDHLIDDDAYNALDWDTYGRCRKELKELDDQAFADWHAMLAVESELVLNERFGKETESLQALIDEGKAIELGTALADLNSVVRDCAREKILFHMDDPVKRVYHEYLRMTGQETFLETLLKMEEKEKQEN